MMRLIALLLFGYCSYRIVHEFIDSVQSDFKPMPLLPSPDRQKHDAHRARIDRIASRKRATGR